MRQFAPVGADQAKRSTLKRLGLLAASTSLVGATHLEAANDTGLQVPMLDVQTRLSSATNDLEIVITNIGNADADIRRLLPHEASTRRGRFDFTSVTDERGALKLAVGEHVSVPMHHHPVVLDGSDVTVRIASLTDTLRRSMSAELANGERAPMRIRGLTPLA